MGFGVVLLEADGLAILGDGIVQLALILQGDAEVVVGFGEVRLEAEASRYSVMASSNWPFNFRAMPRLPWASAKSFLRRMASRYSVMASSNWPFNLQGDAEVAVG